MFALTNVCCVSEFISRIFDGDLSATREEAYSKFRERQVKEAM